jgi:hypothetical protein
MGRLRVGYERVPRIGGRLGATTRELQLGQVTPTIPREHTLY